jgi:hypothetical protein
MSFSPETQQIIAEVERLSGRPVQHFMVAEIYQSISKSAERERT